LQHSRQEEELGVESPALNLLLREYLLRGVAGESFKSALRVA
jgi:hypothetical protein